MHTQFILVYMNAYPSLSHLHANAQSTMSDLSIIT